MLALHAARVHTAAAPRRGAAACMCRHCARMRMRACIFGTAAKVAEEVKDAWYN